jgi:hypothetical protein
VFDWLQGVYFNPERGADTSSRDLREGLRTIHTQTKKLVVWIRSLAPNCNVAYAIKYRGRGQNGVLEDVYYQ